MSVDAPHVADESEQGLFEPVPVWRWGLWYSLIGVAILVFYVLLTPLWLGLRALAWIAEFRARRA